MGASSLSLTSALACGATAVLAIALVRYRRVLKAQKLGGFQNLAAAGLREGRLHSERHASRVRYLAMKPSTSSSFAQLIPEGGRARDRRRILNRKLIVAMVGLPARGKSYIVRMLLRYMAFCKGVKGRLFNVGDYRRKHGLGGVSSSFFDRTNAEALKAREHMAQAVLDELLEWLEEDEANAIGVFDATNTTVARRRMLVERCRSMRVIFVESICTDETTLQRNYKLKLRNKDYEGRDPEEALQDFLARVREYEAAYQEVEDAEATGVASYVKIFNVGHKSAAMNCKGFLQCSIALYLQNIHITPRRIWVLLPAESQGRILGVLGGATAEGELAKLTEDGRRFAADLPRFFGTEGSRRRSSIFGDEGAAAEADADGSGTVLFLGPDPVSEATTEHLRFVCPLWQTTPLLHTTHFGDLTSMRLKDARRSYPDVWTAFAQDPLHFRWPGAGGESYADVISRMEPLLLELERQKRDVCCIAPEPCAQAILAYFLGKARDEVPDIEVGLHAIYELRPGPFRTEMDIISPSQFF